VEVVRQGGGVILVKRGVVGTLVRVGVLARGLSLWVVVVVAVVVGAVTLARLVVVAPITLHHNLMPITLPRKDMVISMSHIKPVQITPTKAMVISTSHMHSAETTPTKARADKEEGQGVEEEEEEEARIKILGKSRRLRRIKCCHKDIYIYTHTHTTVSWYESRLENMNKAYLCSNHDMRIIFNSSSNIPFGRNDFQKNQKPTTASSGGRVHVSGYWHCIHA